MRTALIVVLAAVAFAEQQAPQPTIRENRVMNTTAGPDGSKAGAAQPQGAPGQAIDSILNATEDLNAIRDGYLRRLAGDGCAPDIAIRVADLRAKLRDKQAQPAQTVPAGAPQTNAEIEGSLLVLAADWYKPRPEPAPPVKGSPSAARDAERARLLDYVLTPRDPQAAAAQPSGDAAHWKAELDRLLATCRSAAR